MSFSILTDEEFNNGHVTRLKNISLTNLSLLFKQFNLIKNEYDGLLEIRESPDFLKIIRELFATRHSKKEVLIAHNFLLDCVCKYVQYCLPFVIDDVKLSLEINQANGYIKQIESEYSKKMLYFLKKTKHNNDNVKNVAISILLENLFSNINFDKIHVENGCKLRNFQLILEDIFFFRGLTGDLCHINSFLYNNQKADIMKSFYDITDEEYDKLMNECGMASYSYNYAICPITFKILYGDGECQQIKKLSFGYDGEYKMDKKIIKMLE
jgi:hypothetical protein